MIGLGSDKNGEHETHSTSLDEGIILPTSLPTSASVSRLIEGEQLHNVVIDHAIRIFYHCHRLILKRLGCQPSCQRIRSSPACAGQPLSLCIFRIMVSLGTLYVTGIEFFYLLTGTLNEMACSLCPPRLIRKALGHHFKRLQQS